jgi:hypothetical protein
MSEDEETEEVVGEEEKAEVNADLVKRLLRKEFFPKLMEMSTKLHRLFREAYVLRSLFLERIDVEESPSLNYDQFRTEIAEVLERNKNCETVEVLETEDTEAEAFKLEDADQTQLTPFTLFMIREQLKDGASKDKIIADATQYSYLNRLLKHREFGFAQKGLILNAYRLNDWCAQINDICNSLLQTFEHLAKDDILLFPHLDKDLHEAIYAATKLQTLIQQGSIDHLDTDYMSGMTEQTRQISEEQLNLYLKQGWTEGEKNEDGKITVKYPADPIVGKTIVKIHAPLGKHIVIGDPILELSDGTVIRLNPKELSPQHQRQASWSIAYLYVKVGDTITPMQPLFKMAAINVKVVEHSFIELFHDAWRQLGRVQSKAHVLRETLEEEYRHGGFTVTPSTETGYQYQPERFKSLLTKTEKEDEDKAKDISEKTGVSASLAKDSIRKVGRALRKTRARVPEEG